MILGPLRYLIGADDSMVERPGTIVEYSYDLDHGRTRYGNLRDEKKNGQYGPYLPADDITGRYGEYTPDPQYEGFLRNVRDQVERVKSTGGERIELDNPDSVGLELSAVLSAHDLAWEAGLHTIGKNPLLVSDPAKYLAHPSIDLVVVEHGAGGSDSMQNLRVELHQPLLAVRFVAFNDQDEHGSSWASAVARRIKAKGYKNMGVTISMHGEYTASRDLIVPMQ